MKEDRPKISQTVLCMWGCALAPLAHCTLRPPKIETVGSARWEHHFSLSRWARMRGRLISLVGKVRGRIVGTVRVSSGGSSHFSPNAWSFGSLNLEFRLLPKALRILGVSAPRIQSFGSFRVVVFPLGFRLLQTWCFGSARLLHGRAYCIKTSRFSPRSTMQSYVLKSITRSRDRKPHMQSNISI